MAYTLYYLFPLLREGTFFAASSSFWSTKQSALLAATMSNSNSTLNLSKLFSSSNLVFSFCNRTCCLVLGTEAAPAPAEKKLDKFVKAQYKSITGKSITQL